MGDHEVAVFCTSPYHIGQAVSGVLGRLIPPSSAGTGKREARLTGLGEMALMTAGSNACALHGNRRASHWVGPHHVPGAIRHMPLMSALAVTQDPLSYHGFDEYIATRSVTRQLLGGTDLVPTET